MIIAIDFDGVVVRQNHRYDDLESPLQFEPGAPEALRALKHAKHILLLWSGRSSRALRFDPEFDPLVRAGVRKVNRGYWERMKPINVARFEQMVAFVNEHLPSVFDAIDDGVAGKPNVDLIIDNQAVRFGQGIYSLGWRGIALAYGDSEIQPPST